jgi:hypothetical protein
MVEDVRDTITYIVENKRAKFIVSRNRNGSVRQVYSGRADSFVGALAGLMGYQSDCFLAHSKGRTSEYFGAGSDRGEWEDRQLAIWQIDPSSSLLCEEQNLLRRIIGMHNKIVSAEVTKL